MMLCSDYSLLYICADLNIKTISFYSHRIRKIAQPPLRTMLQESAA